MLRFLSRRKGRNTAAKSAAPQTRIGAESTRFVPNKNLAQCRVILLDGTDLSVDLTVSPLFFIKFVSRTFLRSASSTCGMSSPSPLGRARRRRPVGAHFLRLRPQNAGDIIMYRLLSLNNLHASGYELL